MSYQNLRKRTEGFTIIEVLIVLAIAGLIMMVVFLAVPALRRNSNNTQRRNETSSLLGAVQESINNNNGNAPTGTTVPAALSAVKLTQLSTINYNVAAAAPAPTLPANIDGNTIVIRNFYKCGTAANTGTVQTATTNMTTATGATKRSMVALYNIETTAGFQQVCQEI